MLKTRHWVVIEIVGLFVLWVNGALGQDNTRKKTNFRIGYTLQTIQDINTKDAQAVTTILTEAIIRKKNLAASSETIVFEDVVEIEKDFSAGLIDVVAMTTMQYLEFKFKDLLEPAFVAQVNENIFNSFYLIVRRDSGIRSLADLKDKSLLISASQLRGLPELWMETILLKAGLPVSKRLFSSVKILNKSSQALLPVFFRQADVCLITRFSYEVMVELNPQLEKDLTYFAVSPEFLTTIICISKKMGDDIFLKQIRNSIRDLNLEPNGQQILTIFKINKLVPFEPIYLENVERLLAEYQQLKTGSSHAAAK